MADTTQMEVAELRLQLAMEKKRLEEERKQLELERKKQTEEFKKMQDGLIRKQEMGEAEDMRLKLDLERKRLEEERKQLAMEKMIQEEEYKKLQDDLRRQVRLGHDDRVPVADSSASSATNPDSTHSPLSKSDMICVVCGDKANGMHYKALTCEGCKIFFRRNSKRQDSLKCNNENKGQCEMDLYMRRHCAFCRMKKCLDMGMQIGRVWDQERCKTRKPVKKSSGSPPHVPETKSNAPGNKRPLEAMLDSGVEPTMTEEQRQLIQLVKAAFYDALKECKDLPDKTTQSLDEIRRQKQRHGSTNDLQEEQLAQALIETVDMEALYSPNYFQDFLQSDIFQGESDTILSSGEEAVKSLDENNIELDEAMCKHFMELIVVGLKHLIAFVKALPGFLDMSCEDQAALVKETFADYFCIKMAGFFNVEHKAFICSGKPTYTIKDMRDAGFGGWIDVLVPFSTQMSRLNLTQEEHPMLCAICVITPDRPVLSSQAKQIIGHHHEKLVEALCASVRFNHSDQPQYFAKVVGLLTELRNCTECLMEQVLQLKLKGQAILPILGEVLDI